MKILGGIYRGRKINMPKGIRPTQNKARKALFDILQDVQGLMFLELFAGSGAVGIEAASRGALEVVLVEHASPCIAAIKGNIASLGLKSCQVLPLDTDRAIQALYREGRRFDIVFFDPPYYKELAKKTLQTLGAYDIVAAHGFVIAQHFKKDNLPEGVGKLFIFKQASYGDTRLTFYRKK